MNRVHGVYEKPLAQMGPVALLIGISRPNQRHVGICHRSENPPQISLLHLEDDRALTNGAPLPGYLWIDPNIHPRRLSQVAAICRNVWKTNQRGGIPFGFGPPTDCFDEETHSYLFGPTHLGLTCATFVLAVFHRAGLQLVNYASWPTERLEDAAWQQEIIKYLERTILDKERILQLKEVVGKAVRYRPEEVAGAATVSPRPVAYEDAAKRGVLVLAKLQSVTAPPRAPDS
jgi:hypothetical protein